MLSRMAEAGVPSLAPSFAPTHTEPDNLAMKRRQAKWLARLLLGLGVGVLVAMVGARVCRVFGRERAMQSARTVQGVIAPPQQPLGVDVGGDHGKRSTDNQPHDAAIAAAAGPASPLEIGAFNPNSGGRGWGDAFHASQSSNSAVVL